MKYESGGKIIKTFATAAPETHGYRVQKDEHEQEVKKSASKELTFHDFDKCLHDITKYFITPIKYFDDKDTPDCIEELKKTYKEFTKND